MLRRKVRPVNVKSGRQGRNHAKLRARATGDGSISKPRAPRAGPPIVLLHGWACHGGYFAPQLKGLADRFRLIAPDLRGHRFSHQPGDAPDLATLAGDLQALLEALALPDPVLVGWSMGALVAFEFIRRQGSAHAAGLVVVDMTPRVVNDAAWDLGLLGGYGPHRRSRRRI